MNAKEMEALIIKQGEYLQAVEKKAQANLEAHMHLVQRADNIVEGFKQELAARDHRIKMLEDLHDARRNEIEALTADAGNHHNRIAVLEERIVQLSMASDAARQELTAVHEQMSEMRDQQDGMNDTLYGSVGRIEKLETLVLARNASAATKRNMTDEDALRVLTGDLRETSHKEAAEKIGLTYAQVYSCRLEFTFKHVHKDLRDNVKGWKNVWAK